MRTGKIASGAEYRMDEQFQNLLIFEILKVLKFWKFYNLEYFKNVLFRKSREFLIWKISQFPNVLI